MRQGRLPPFAAPWAQNAALRSSLNNLVTTPELFSSARTSGMVRAPGDTQNTPTPQRRSSSITTAAWRWARLLAQRTLCSVPLLGSISRPAFSQPRHATWARPPGHTNEWTAAQMLGEYGPRGSPP